MMFVIQREGETFIASSVNKAIEVIEAKYGGQAARKKVNNWYTTIHVISKSGHLIEFTAIKSEVYE